MKITGITGSRFGEASANIKLQSPHFNGLPYKDRLHPGTINLNIDPMKFEVIKSDYFYENINWGPMTENFGLIQVIKLGEPGKLRDILGYLYLPSGSLNMRGGKILEIWTEWIEGIEKNDALEIEIPGGYLLITGAF